MGETVGIGLGDRAVDVVVGNGLHMQSRNPAGGLSVDPDDGDLRVGECDVGFAGLVDGVRRSPRIVLVAAMLPCIPAVWVNRG